MTVIEISKDRHMELAGEPWKACMSKVDGKDIVATDITYGTIAKRTNGQPPILTELGVAVPSLGFGNVWLREVSGRAFLYLTNY